MKIKGNGLTFTKINQHLEKILSSFDLAVFTVNEKRLIQDWSKLAEQFTGYKKKDVIGKDCADILQVASKKCRNMCSKDCHMLEAFKTGQLKICADDGMALRHKNGEKVFTQTTSVPLYDENDTLIGGIEIFNNKLIQTADNVPLREKLEKFASLFEGALEGIIAIDCKSDQIIFANKTMCHLTGYSQKELEALTQEHLYPKDRRNMICQTCRSCSSDLVHDLALEVPILKKDHSIVYCDVNFVRIELNGDECAMAFFEDISQRRMALKRYELSKHDLKDSLINTIMAIASTIEMRDPYTAGHQRRVAQIAVEIAKEMQLSKVEIEGIRLGALIHDIGKVYIPSEILNRPGKLSDTEFALIQSHPQVGENIIKDIPFPWPIKEMILHHHERLDGSGYPDHLTGDAINLFSRILAVSDVVEAMSSHRPYRPALGVDKALAEIKRGINTLYDEVVVNACIKIFEDNKIQLDPNTM